MSDTSPKDAVKAVARPIVDGRVDMAELYSRPWFFRRQWVFKCGRCERDMIIHTFASQPRCAFCFIKNVPPVQHWYC